MPIEITNFVIHQIEKNEQGPKKAQQLLDLTKEVNSSLARDIVELYSEKTTIAYGRFSNLGHLFPRSFRENVINADKVTINSEQFYSVSCETVEEMSELMKATTGTGGYVAFITYKSAEKPFFISVLIKDTKAYEIENLEPTESFKVDISKLHQAVHININMMHSTLQAEKEEENEGEGGANKARAKPSYIGFLSKSSEPIEYFINAFSCRQHSDNSKASSNAPTAVKRMLLSIGVEKEKAQQAMDETVNFIIENNNKRVSVRSLNNIANKYIPEDMLEEKEDYFFEYLKQNEIEIPDDFTAKKGSVKRFIRTYYKTPEWSIDIENSLIGLARGDENDEDDDDERMFVYDQDNGRLTLTDIPPELVDKIERAVGLKQDEEEENE